MIVLDSDVIIESLERDSAKGEEALRRVEDSGEELAITSITLHEVLYGLGRRGHRSDQLDLVPVLEFRAEDARMAAELEVELGRRGVTVARADCMVAGCAITRKARLFTFNTRHFARMRDHGLRLF